MKKTATSRSGWWIAGLLEKHSHPNRSPFWNNYRLVKADDWRTAFMRATEMGVNDANTGNEAFPGCQEFIGVSDLLPIYDELEDGAELLYQKLEPSEPMMAFHCRFSRRLISNRCMKAEPTQMKMSPHYPQMIQRFEDLRGTETSDAPEPLAL